MEEPATSITPSLWASLNGWFTSTVLFILLNLMIATIVFTSNLPDNNNPQNHQQHQDDDNEHKHNSHHHRNQPQIARSPSILHRIKSFNFYPQKSQHESSPEETHYHPQPLEVAATQYVFNQPLEYQHFDFDSSNSVHDLNRINEFNDVQVQSPHTENHGSDFDPTRAEMRGDTGFEFEPIQNEIHETRGDTGFGNEPEDELQSLDEVYSKLKTGRHDRTKSDGNIRPKPAAKMKKSTSLKVGFTHLEEEEIVEARRPATVKEKRTAAVKAVHDDDVEVDSKADDFINKFKNDLKLQRIESIMRTKGTTTTNRGSGK